MILHTHHIDEDGDIVPVYVVHAHPTEAKVLADAIYAALERNPDSESYAITLGRVEDLDVPQQQEEPVEKLQGLTKNGELLIPTKGLIVP